MSLDICLQLQHGNFHLNVEFQAPKTGITAIFGPSGCGKTTLLRAIAGLHPCQHATITINGKNWQNAHTCLPTHKRRLAYVFQEANLFSHLNVEKNLTYGLRRSQKHYPSTIKTIDIHEVIELLGIQHLLTRDTENLSGGERQRVAIARALLSQPELLLMDEPLSALDRKSKLEILPYLEQLHRNFSLPILYVSHSTEEVVRLADYLIVLQQGHIQAQGPLTTVVNQINSPLIQHTALEQSEALSVLSVIVDKACNDFGLSEFVINSHQPSAIKLYTPYTHTVQDQQQVRLKNSRKRCEYHTASSQR